MVEKLLKNFQHTAKSSLYFLSSHSIFKFLRTVFLSFWVLFCSFECLPYKNPKKAWSLVVKIKIFAILFYVGNYTKESLNNTLISLINVKSRLLILKIPPSTKKIPLHVYININKMLFFHYSVSQFLLWNLKIHLNIISIESDRFYHSMFIDFETSTPPRLFQLLRLLERWEYIRKIFCLRFIFRSGFCI